MKEIDCNAPEFYQNAVAGLRDAGRIGAEGTDLDATTQLLGLVDFNWVPSGWYPHIWMLAFSLEDGALPVALDVEFRSPVTTPLAAGGSANAKRIRMQFDNTIQQTVT